MLEVGVTVEKIECVRLSERATGDSKANYKLNVSLSEKHRRPDGLTIAFNLELTGFPEVAKITVAGSAKLTGSEADINEGIAAGVDKKPPKVVEAIYERLYGLIYSMAGSMKVPYPMPNLLKKTI